MRLVDSYSYEAMEHAVNTARACVIGNKDKICSIQEEPDVGCTAVEHDDVPGASRFMSRRCDIGLCSIKGGYIDIIGTVLVNEYLFTLILQHLSHIPWRSLPSSVPRRLNPPALVQHPEHSCMCA